MAGCAPTEPREGFDRARADWQSEAMIEGVLLDLSGVLYGGGQAIPGSVAAVTRLRKAGLKLRFLTNSTRTPRRKLLKNLDDMGFDLDESEVFTPAKAACERIRAQDARAHLLIHPDLNEDFEDLPEGAGPMTVVMGDAGPFFTYEAVNTAFRALDQGAGFLALAANRSFLDEDGERSLDMGAYVAALEYASGTQAEVLGKPAPGFFAAALDSMGCAPDRAVMVGDDAEADVAGALKAGLGAAVLVRTGKFCAGDETRHTPCPSHVADDLARAVDWILQKRA